MYKSNHIPPANDRHNACTVMYDSGVCENDRESEAGENNHRCYESSQVNWSTAFISSRKVLAATVRENSIGKGCKDEYEGYFASDMVIWTEYWGTDRQATAANSAREHRKE